jgi:hypothetical protein
MIGLKIFDSDGCLLGRNIADCIWVSRGTGQLKGRLTVDAIDADNISQHARPLVGRLPVKEYSISTNTGKRDNGSDGDFEPQKRDKLL